MDWLALSLICAFSLASTDAATKAWLQDYSARELTLASPAAAVGPGTGAAVWAETADAAAPTLLAVALLRAAATTAAVAAGGCCGASRARQPSAVARPVWQR